jgi:PKD repeat protein
VSITNTSAFSNTPNSSLFTKFFWSFGDGTSFIGQNPGTHNYPDTGTYSIRLIMRDSTSCNSPDTLIKTIKINGKRVQALFNMPDSICLTNSIVLNSLAINANSFTWRFGDGSTSSISPIVKTYTNVGTYTVTLIAVNLATCNKVDSIQKTIKVFIAKIQSKLASFSGDYDRFEKKERDWLNKILLTIVQEQALRGRPPGSNKEWRKNVIEPRILSFMI